METDRMQAMMKQAKDNQLQQVCILLHFLDEQT
jgi:hypothetical protein